jgi:transcription elongation GreA/GreB family factor
MAEVTMSDRGVRVGTTAVRTDQFALRCATCEVPITSQLDCEDGETFCCAGCVAGGPCICTSEATADDTPGAMGTALGAAGWPIDVRVMKHLLARIERLAAEPPDRDASDHLRRLDMLSGYCGAVSVTFDPEVAAIGRRVTIGGEDGRTESFWLSLPGDEDATADTISIAAPAGRSLAGARVGDVVYLESEGRRRWAVVLRVA